MTHDHDDNSNNTGPRRDASAGAGGNGVGIGGGNGGGLERRVRTLEVGRARTEAAIERFDEKTDRIAGSVGEVLVILRGDGNGEKGIGPRLAELELVKRRRDEREARWVRVGTRVALALMTLVAGAMGYDNLARAVGAGMEDVGAVVEVGSVGGAGE